MSKRLNTGVSTKRVKPVSSHLLKRRVSKIHPTKTSRRSPLTPTTKGPVTSHWRSTRTTRGKTWPVVHLRPKAPIVPPKLVTVTRRSTSSQLTTPKPYTPISLTKTTSTSTSGNCTHIHLTPRQRPSTRLRHTTRIGTTLLVVCLSLVEGLYLGVMCL